MAKCHGCFNFRHSCLSTLRNRRIRVVDPTLHRKIFWGDVLFLDFMLPVDLRAGDCVIFSAWLDRSPTNYDWPLHLVTGLLKPFYCSSSGVFIWLLVCFCQRFGLQHLLRPRVFPQWSCFCVGRWILCAFNRFSSSTNRCISPWT